MLATYQRFAQANANNLVEEALAALPFSTGEMSDLRTFFVGRDFFDICTRIFGAVDMNGTQSIDKNELLDAFQQLLSELPGVTDILERRSLQPSVFCSSLSMELVSQTFQVFDVDQSGVLEWNEFPNAVRLIWVRALQLVKDRPVSDQLVEAALQNLADTCGVGLAKHLHAYFGSFDFSDLCTRVFEGADADKSDSMSKTETHEAFKYIIHKQIGDVHKELAGFFESATLSEASVLSQTAIDSVYTSLDTNQSGTIQKIEFINATKLIWVQAILISQEKRFGAAFAAIDQALNDCKVGDDFSSTADQSSHFRKFFRSLSYENACTRVFHEMDKDNSGTLKKEEMFHSFSRLWQVFPGLREALKGIDSMIDVQKKSSHVDILVQEVFDQFDSDSSGNLNLNEFPHLVAFIIIRLLKDSHSILKVEVREKRVHSSSSCDESKNHRPLKKSKIGEDIIERLFAELRQQEALTNSVESCDEITKSRENKTDKNCRNDHNDANAKIEYLRGVFTNNKFDPACHQVFAQIDQDKSGRIDACEFANAFYIVISHIPGAIERLKQCGVDCSDGVVASSITSELVKVVFGELNIDIQNGSISRIRFPIAIRVMWVKIMSTL